MLKRFTSGARDALRRANREALRLGHEYIGTEHMILALIDDRSGVTPAVLTSLGLDPAHVAAEVERSVQTDALGLSAQASRLPHTPWMKKVIEAAIDEAHASECRHVGAEHLFLGILAVREGVAGHVLLDLGVTLEAGRAAVARELASPPRILDRPARDDIPTDESADEGPASESDSPTPPARRWWQFWR